MLILARKIGQKIVIGDDIHVTVIEVRGEQVRLGITAPRAISVHRQELWDQISDENQKALIETISDLSGTAPRAVV